jgi:leader peptidase (prepilin peptidase)/N-methyltransferase
MGELMSATQVVAWAAVGAIAGAAVQPATRRLLTIDNVGVLTARPTTPLLTAILFGILAWRLGWTLDLIAYSFLAATGVVLAIIDTLEHRLPSTLVLPSFAVLAALFVASAIINAGGADLLRAAAASGAVTGFYVVLALASGGGLGAGDVKLGGLLGLALGWMGWQVVLAGVFLGWCFGGVTWLILRATGVRPRLLPAGPFLLLGAFVAIGATPPA